MQLNNIIPSLGRIMADTSLNALFASLSSLHSTYKLGYEFHKEKLIVSGRSN